MHTAWGVYTIYTTLFSPKALELGTRREVVFGIDPSQRHSTQRLRWQPAL